MNVTVVIAAYNEAATIAALTSRLIQSLDTIPESRWRLIYVIEGADGSKEIAEGFSRKRAEIEVIYAEKPSGLANAFRRGFEAVPDATDVLVTMDADLNHQPEEIPRLVAALSSREADVVIGSRKVPGSTVVGAPLCGAALEQRPESPDEAHDGSVGRGSDLRISGLPLFVLPAHLILQYGIRLSARDPTLRQPVGTFDPRGAHPVCVQGAWNLKDALHRYLFELY